MSDKAVIMIRVGADTGNLGHQCPLLSKDKYEFLPVGPSQTGCYKYSEMVGITEKPLSYYLEKKSFCDSYAHYDPDFIHLTYGDCRNENSGKVGPKVKAIRKLRENDLLIFWAVFNPWNNGYDKRKNIAAIIGWFVINYVFDWDNPSISDQQQVEDYKNWKVNAHYRQSDSLEKLKACDLVVAYGKDGGQLVLPIIIGEREHRETNFNLNSTGKNLFKDKRKTIYTMSSPYHLDYDKVCKIIKGTSVWKPTFKFNCKRKD